PTVFVVGLVLSGILAVVATGYWSSHSRGESALAASVIGRPWPLYLWLCVGWLTLQISLLRHRGLRSRLLATLIVSVSGIAVAGIIAYVRPRLDLLLHAWLTTLVSTSWLYTALNFGVLVAAMAGVARSWRLDVWRMRALDFPYGDS